MAVQSAPIIWREPEVFASGDTLLFQRFLPAYLPADGWSLLYTLTNGAGNEVFQFASAQSTVDLTCHAINVPNFGAGLDAGDYVLSAQAVNLAGNAGKGIAAGEKHTIYYAELTLDPDLADGLAGAPVETFMQSMIPILEAKIKRLEAYDLTETDAARSKYVVEQRAQAWERYWRLLEFRNYEKKNERANNTGINQNLVVPQYIGGW